VRNDGGRKEGGVERGEKSRAGQRVRGVSGGGGARRRLRGGGGGRGGGVGWRKARGKEGRWRGDGNSLGGG